MTANIVPVVCIRNDVVLRPAIGAGRRGPDGGAVNWAQQLTQNLKERMFISGPAHNHLSTR